MIPRQEMQENAVEFIRALNGQGILGLGAIIIFFDTKHGAPVVAGNVPRAQMQMVLGEVLKALPSIEVREELSVPAEPVSRIHDVTKDS